MANSTAISNIVRNVSVSWLAGGSMSVSGTTMTVTSITTVAYIGTAFTGINSITAASATDLTLAGGTAGTSAVKVSNTTAATSATTGAFQVGTGIGMGGGAIYATGVINSGSNIIVTGSTAYSSASSGTFSYGGSATNIQSFGANAATAGTFAFRQKSSDSSVDRLVLSTNAAGDFTFGSTGTHTFGTTNTVTMAAGVLTATGNISTLRGGTSLITSESTVNGAVSEFVAKGLNSAGTARQANLGINRFADDVFSISDGTTERFRLGLTNGNSTFPGTGTHTFGTTNTVSMAAGVLTATGAGNFGGSLNLTADNTRLNLNRSSTGAYSGLSWFTSASEQWFLGLRETGTANFFLYNPGTASNSVTVARADNAVTLAGNLTVSGTGTSSFASAVNVTNGTASDIRRTGLGTASFFGVQSITAVSSGDMADGFGAGLFAQIRDTAGVDNTIGQMGFVRAGADNTGAFSVLVASAGSLTERMRVSTTAADFTGITTPGTSTTNAAILGKSMGLTENLFVGGNVNFSGTGASTLGAAGSVFTYNGAVASTSTSTGTVVISGAGGLGVGGNGFFGGDLTVSGGNVGIGTAALAYVGAYVSTSLSGSTGQYGVLSSPTFGSGATTLGASISANFATAAAAFAMTSGNVFEANSPTVGAGSSVGTMTGLQVKNQGAAGITNAYGIDIAAQSGASSLNIGLRNAGTTLLTNATEATSISAASTVLSGGLSVTKTAIIGTGLGLGVTNTATSGGTLTLAAGSTTIHVLTGSSAHTVQLPAANLMGAGIAVSFTIKSRSSGTITILSAGSDRIEGSVSYTLPGGSSNSVTLLSNGVGEWELV